MTSINDTAGKLPLVSTTPAQNLPPISTTPAANFATGLASGRWAVANLPTVSQHRWKIANSINDTANKFATSVNDTGGKQ
jgi:hypothetical protein